ncbi:MAG TPA: tetratricopeptide repeat protein [Bryobacteraceae bacterium]|nr:tetratricopeptide repeat protein [Bryobacteraceae bacterium]
MMHALVLLSAALQNPDFEYLYREALAIRERQLGNEHPKVAASLIDLALYLKGRGDTAEPRQLLRRAVAVYEKTNAAQVAVALEHLAELLQPSEAEPLLRRALASSPDRPHLLLKLADLLERRGKLDEAESLYRRALARQESTMAETDPAIAATCNNLGLIIEGRGQPAEAGVLFSRAVSIYERAYGRRHPEYATALTNLAGTLRARGDAASAVPLLEQAHTVLESTLGPDHAHTRQACTSLASALAEAGDRAAAGAIQRRCR